MNDGSSRCSWHTWRIIYIYIITFSSIIWYFWTFFFLCLFFLLLLLCSEVFICSGPCWLHTSAKKSIKSRNHKNKKQTKKVMKLVLFNKSANASVRDTSSRQKIMKKKNWQMWRLSCSRCVRSLQEVSTKSTFGISSPQPRSSARGGCDASQRRFH